jgi:GNAT superfamily N-acetyltransferase
MIRNAQETDFLRLLDMGWKFAVYTGLPTPFSPESAERMIRFLLETGVVLVSETDGVVEGAIMGMVTPIWYAGAFAAAELALWVSPDRRTKGVARSLIEAFESWGRDQGVEYFAMSDLSVDGTYPAGGMFERMGYRPFERAHIKEAY